MLYSKVVTIRDAQLNEKKVIQKEREARRKEDQKQGAQVIITQMKERELERLRQM